MVKIRLTRTGRKHYHTFRIVATEATNPRDGRFNEILGSYDPNLANNDEKKFVFNKERIELLNSLVDSYRESMAESELCQKPAVSALYIVDPDPKRLSYQ